MSAAASGRPIAVTGATGFVGRHLMADLERRGLAPAAVRLGLDPKTDWRGALAGFDCVVHLAAAAHEEAERYERTGDYAGISTVNALATERLARDAAAVGVRQLVFLSTIGVHGEETFGAPFTEESPAAPRSLYARSKLEAEQLLSGVMRESGLAVTILRPTLVYGPGNGGNMLRLLRFLERGWPLPFAAAANRRSLTYVGNLVSAIAAVIERRRPGDVFIVCDSQPISTPELLIRLGDALGNRPRLFPVPEAWLRFVARVAGQQPAARRLLGSLEADCGKLARSLDWIPPFGTSEALERTAAWYRNQACSSTA